MELGGKSWDKYKHELYTLSIISCGYFEIQIISGTSGKFVSSSISFTKLTVLLDIEVMETKTFEDKPQIFRSAIL